MVSLERDTLVFAFPEVHPKARLSITFQRTLRIPDDGTDYPLPPGLGEFPLCHVDDFAAKVPKEWVDHGGVMLPMYQSEAMWVKFSSAYLSEHEAAYPFAIKVATGKIDAVSGSQWRNGLHFQPQDYVVVPGQRWLDGYCVEKGIVRQFVAMPLGGGHTVEEQITGQAEHGGLQIAAFPMRRAEFDRRFPKEPPKPELHENTAMFSAHVDHSMGLGAGGRMRQEVYEDPFNFEDWDTGVVSRCFVHIVNSLVWRSISGKNPPTVPFTAKEYTEAGLPWFEYYDDKSKAIEGSGILAGVKSVFNLSQQNKKPALPENESVTPQKVVELRAGMAQDQVREWNP